MFSGSSCGQSTARRTCCFGSPARTSNRRWTRAPLRRKLVPSMKTTFLFCHQKRYDCFSAGVTPVLTVWRTSVWTIQQVHRAVRCKVCLSQSCDRSVTKTLDTGSDTRIHFLFTHSHCYPRRNQLQTFLEKNSSFNPKYYRKSVYFSHISF